MTSHRLITCGSADLLQKAVWGHLVVEPDTAVTGGFPRWRYSSDHLGDTAWWVARLRDGSVLGCCLEVEPGANGVLAHLSTAAVSGPICSLPARARKLALQIWTERQLKAIAKGIHAPLRKLSTRRPRGSARSRRRAGSPRSSAPRSAA